MRALVLSGGGSKGAYQAGVLMHLLAEQQTRYEIVCGVSVGAINAAGLAQFRLGQETLAANWLQDLWLSLTTQVVYRKWRPFSIPALWKSSFYDSRPLRRFLQRHLDPERVRTSGRQLRLGAVGIDTGCYVPFSQAHSDLITAVLASSAFPGALTPQTMAEGLMIDGGCRDITPLRAALDAGADEIDVVLCSPPGKSAPVGRNPHAIKVAMQAIDIMADEIVRNDLAQAELWNRMVRLGEAPNKREVKLRLFRPSVTLPGDTLDFDPEQLKFKFDLGRADAKRQA